MGKSRLTAFSDGVFAIVITLLVFQIKVPHVSEQYLQSALLALWPKFLSFGLSFIIIGVHWISHHNMMHYIDQVDRISLWLNNMMLMMVCIIPFPTAVIGEYLYSVTAIILYGVNLIAVNLIATLFWYYSTSKNRLVSKNLNPSFVRNINMLHISVIIMYGIATGMSLLNIWIAYTLYVAVPVFFILPNPFLKNLFTRTHFEK